MKKTIVSIIHFLLITLVGLFSAGCYTILNQPPELQEQSVESNFEDEIAEESFQEEGNNGDYTIINNYSCDHGSNCCGHHHCHTYSTHHDHSCGGYCQLTFNWWTGTYYWNPYHYGYYHNHYYTNYYGYHHGYHDGYYDGYYDGYWWGYNNWDNNYDDDDGSSDYTQDRRDRSFSRIDDTNEGSDEESYAHIKIQEVSDKKISSQAIEGSSDPIQANVSYNKKKKSSSNTSNIKNKKSYGATVSKSTSPPGYKSHGTSSKKEYSKRKRTSVGANFVGAILNVIINSPKSKKSKSKGYSHKKSSGKSRKHSSSSQSKKSKGRKRV